MPDDRAGPGDAEPVPDPPVRHSACELADILANGGAGSAFPPRLASPPAGESA
jgi:hypothetical protein